MAESGSIPKALQDKPSLQSIDAEAWNAFVRLSPRRPVSGFGSVGAIPYIELLAFLDGVACIEDTEDRDVLIELVEFLDSDFLKEVSEKQKAEAEKSKAAATAKSARR